MQEWSGLTFNCLFLSPIHSIKRGGGGFWLFTHFAAIKILRRSWPTFWAIKSTLKPTFYYEKGGDFDFLHILRIKSPRLRLGLFIAAKCVKSQNHPPFYTIKSHFWLFTHFANKKPLASPRAFYCCKMCKKSKITPLFIFWNTRVRHYCEKLFFDTFYGH